MRRLAQVLAAIAVAGCVGGPHVERDVARYDFGPAAKLGAAEAVLPLRSVEVIAPSWLDSPLLQYRLLYTDASRRQSYADSRWVAPPGELLTVALRRYLATGASATANEGCKLRIDLNEFIQLFGAPQQSEGLVELQASLYSARDGSPLARRSFAATVPAATADARGGVGAVEAAVGRIAEDMRNWLAGLDRNTPTGLNVAKACSGL